MSTKEDQVLENLLQAQLAAYEYFCGDQVQGPHNDQLNRALTKTIHAVCGLMDAAHLRRRIINANLPKASEASP